MAYRVLEVTLHSARDLKNVNFISRMEVYAVATISGDPLTRQSTPPDPYGGRHPSWNATLRFTLPLSAAGCLHVLLRAERALGDRDIGEVIVPLSEILSGGGGPYVDMGPRPPQFASYQVRKVHRPEPRGVLHLSYRLGPVVAPPYQPVVDAFPVSPPYEYLPPPPESYLAGRKPPPPPPSPSISKPPPPPATRPAATGAAAVGHVAGLPAPVAAKADRLVTSTPSPVTAKANWQVAVAPPPPEPRTKGMRNNNKNGSFEYEMGLVGGMMTSDVMCDAAVYNAGYRAGLNDRSRAVY